MKRNEMKSTSKQLQGDGIGFNKRNSQKSLTLTMRLTDGRTAKIHKNDVVVACR